MGTTPDQPRSLFLSPDGTTLPDSLVCSGILPPELGGHVCPFAVDGRMPFPVPLDPNDPLYTIDKGMPGDLCPPCAKQQIGHLGHWQGYRGQSFPPDLLSLRLFKCRQWLWLVVPGLHDASPTTLE